MEEKNKKDDLQSRRDFFKKAAKAALPIVGTIVLANMPSLMNAAEMAPMGCDYGCTNTCSGACKGTCRETCSTTCYDQCYNACKTTCKGTCQHLTD